MTIRHFKFRRLVPVVVAASLAIAAVPVLSQPGNANASATRTARIQQHLQARLDRMSQRLQITPAQQTAWTMYVNTVQSLVGTKLPRPAPDADATSIVRLRAERAAERAQKLSQLADATAALQQVLDPQQQKMLNDIVRHAGYRAHHRHRR